MIKQNILPLKQVIGIGILTGMRSAAAPVIAAQILNNNKSQLQVFRSSTGFIPSNVAVNALRMMAFGEFIVDKLPFTPDRTRAISLAVRCIAGGLAGACIFNAAGKKPLTGALVGCVAAGASTFGSFWLRKGLSRAGFGNFLSGVVEDAFVAGAGIKLAQTV